MGNSGIEAVLKNYEAALTSLEQVEEILPPDQVLEVLRTRDAVQAVLNDPTQDGTAKLIPLVRLDSRLKQQAPLITQAVNLDDWRVSWKPPAEAWWWFLDTLPHKLDELDWLWSTLSVTSLTISLSLLANIVARFLSGGLDTLGTFAITVQSVLTLLTAQGALTQGGKEGIKHLLTRLHLPKSIWQEVQLGLSGLLLLGLVGVHSQLPQIGVYYREQGEKNYQAGRLGSAESDYQRALNLKPDDAETHFYLGILYEDLQKYKQARTEYQYAISGGYGAAYNNLARLYILEKKYKAAAFLLKQLENHPDIADVNLKYSWYKNTGWMRFEQSQLTSAKIYLEEAIDLAKNQSPAYCLLAQVLEKQEEAHALTEWRNCLRFATGDTPEEVIWIGMAQEKLASEENSQVNGGN